MRGRCGSAEKPRKWRSAASGRAGSARRASGGAGGLAEEDFVPVDAEVGHDAELAAVGEPVQRDSDGLGLAGGHAHVGVDGDPSAGGVLHLEVGQRQAAGALLRGGAEGAAVGPVDPAVEEKDGVGGVPGKSSSRVWRAAAVGHNIHGYKLAAFVIAAAYAGFAGGLPGVMQGFMPPDAFTFDTSGQVCSADRDRGRGHAVRSACRCNRWLYLSDFLQTTRSSRCRLETGLLAYLRVAGLFPAPWPYWRPR